MKKPTAIFIALMLLLAGCSAAAEKLRAMDDREFWRRGDRVVCHACYTG